MGEIEATIRAAAKVGAFFSGDADKTYTWMVMPNPLLGEVSPKWMIKNGRGEKLLKFIDNAIDENKLQETT